MVSEIVELVRPQPRGKLRGRDFSRTSYRAPATVKRLTKAYNEPVPKSWLSRWLWLIIATLAFLGFLIATVSPIFTIKNVIINNAPSVESEARLRALVKTVLAAKRFGAFPQTSLFYLSTERLAGTISGEVADIDVHIDRHWPNVLRITLPPNVFVATWQSGDKTFILDTRGFLAQTISESGSMLQLTPITEITTKPRILGEQVATPELSSFLQDFSKLWSEILPNFELDKLEVEQSNLPSLKVKTKNGWYAIVSGAGNKIEQLSALKRLLEEKIKGDQDKLEYIDVRFGSKLFFRWKQ